MQERPPVTVTDPQSGDGPDDLLGSDAAPSRRPVVVLALVAALLVGTALVTRSSERREAGEQERRRLSTVSLSYTPQFLVGVEEDVSPAEARAQRRPRLLRYPYGVRNTGRGDVVLVRAALGPLASEPEVVVPAGRSARVLLLLPVPCDGSPPPGPTPGAALVTVRALDGHEQELRLPAGLGPTSLRRAADRACGTQLTRYTVVPYVGIGVLEGDRVVAPIDWDNTAGRDATVRSLAAGPGMQVELQDPAGRPVPLPVELPRAGPAVVLRLVITVQDCDALVLDEAPDDAQDRPTTLSTVVRDEQRAAGGAVEDAEELVTAELPRIAVRRLVEATCP